MKCQSCGKKQATVKYYEDINGNKQEYHFCNDCANKYGIGISDFSNFSNFSDIFSSVFLNIPEFEKKDYICENCGYTLEKYSKTGLLGCPNCYDTFKNSLDDVLLKMHGKNRHIKLKTRNTKKDDKLEKLETLKNKIQECIKEEKYEEAAKIRDEIKKIEGNEKND